MNSNQHPARGRARFPTRTLLLVSSLTLLTAGSASAGLPSPFELHREVREHVGDALQHLARVPDRILDHHERHLESFLGGREYYGPHRHYHSTYHFPVWIDEDVYYRPYTYCDGQLFGSVSVRPRLWVEWGHHDSGHWCDHCHGYFPSSHGHFRRHHDRERYYRHHDYGRYDRRDHYRRDDHHPRYRDHRHDRYCRDDHRDHRRRGDRHHDRGRRGHRHRGHNGGGP